MRAYLQHPLVKGYKDETIIATALLSGVGASLLFPPYSQLSYLASSSAFGGVLTFCYYSLSDTENEKRIYKYLGASASIAAAASFGMTYLTAAVPPVVATYVFTTCVALGFAVMVDHITQDRVVQANRILNLSLFSAAEAGVCVGLAQFSLLNPISLGMVFAANTYLISNGYPDLLQPITKPLTDGLHDLYKKICQPTLQKERV